MSSDRPAPPAPRHDPQALWFAWVVLGALAVLEGVHEIFGGLGPNALFDVWIHDLVVVAAAGLCLLRAVHEPRGRAAWLAFGAGLACWGVGDVLWSALYANDPDPPYPTVADVLWLAWYPLTALGMGLLIRLRVTGFELHRWMDGVAIMLIVLIPGIALLVQPVAEHSSETTLASIVDFSYPVLDVVLLGALVGVYGLLAWRPSRVWIALGVGCLLIVVSDAVFAVEQARGGTSQSDVGFTLTLGALIIAYAAWRSSSEAEPHHDHHGWRAIALPLAAQMLAAAIQVYGLFHELGATERIITLAVLAIASLQIIVSRPRAPDA